MKFTYVVACQQYSTHKRSGDQRADDILRLMITYVFFDPNSLVDFLYFSDALLKFAISLWQVPISTRCNYIDEVEQTSEDTKETSEKIYYSALAKATPQTNHTDSSICVHRDQV